MQCFYLFGVAIKYAWLFIYISHETVCDKDVITKDSDHIK